MFLTVLVSKAGFGTQVCHCNGPIEKIQIYKIPSVVKSNSKYGANLVCLPCTFNI